AGGHRTVRRRALGDLLFRRSHPARRVRPGVDPRTPNRRSAGVIVAVAAAAALATPSRDALIRRWLQANRAHSASELHAPAGAASRAPADLTALAARELATPGRYRLSNPRAVPARESLWVRLVRWLGAQWDRLWNAISKRVHISPRTANGAGWALLAIVGFGLLWAA